MCCVCVVCLCACVCMFLVVISNISSFAQWLACAYAYENMNCHALLVSVCMRVCVGICVVGVLACARACVCKCMFACIYMFFCKEFACFMCFLILHNFTTAHLLTKFHTALSASLRCHNLAASTLLVARVLGRGISY